MGGSISVETESKDNFNGYKCEVENMPSVWSGRNTTAIREAPSHPVDHFIIRPSGQKGLGFIGDMIKSPDLILSAQDTLQISRTATLNVISYSSYYRSLK